MPSASATEVVITVQFAEPVRIGHVLEVAAIYRDFAEQFPDYDQLPPAGPMMHKLTQLDGSEPVSFQSSGLRVRFGAMERGRYITLQDDRLSYGWIRRAGLDQDADYPGFDELLKEFREVWSDVAESLQRHVGGEIRPGLGEIAYVNGAATRDKDGNAIRLSSIYRFLNPDVPPAGVNGYNYSWNETLNVADGILSTSAAGPIVTLGDVPATLLTLTATFQFAEDKDMFEELLTVRGRVNGTYRRIFIGADA